MLCLHTHTLFERSHLRTNVTLRLGLMVVICIVLLILPLSSGWPQDSVTSDAWATPAASSGSTSASTSGSDGVAAYADTAGRPSEQIASVSVLSVLGRLALIVVLAYAVIWGLQQWRERGASLPHSGRGGLIRVRESVRLGSGRLYVVEYGSRNLLISVVADQVTLLSGNCASEVDAADLPGEPAHPQRLSRAFSPGLVPAGSPVSDEQESHHVRLQAEQQRSTSEWEIRRDALVRALQSSVGS